MDYPEEWNELPRHERRQKIRELEKQQQKKAATTGKIRSWLITVVILLLLGFGIYFWSTNRQILPPTDIAGHIEQNPPSHILDEPMSLAVQKHMLEHADGSGPPGVIINYNCADFECEPEMKDKLAEIANKYPEFVYVAPYPKMSVKLAITRMGKIMTFDNFDKDALIRFIEQ